MAKGPQPGRGLTGFGMLYRCKDQTLRGFWSFFFHEGGSVQYMDLGGTGAFSRSSLQTLYADTVFPLFLVQKG